MARIAAEQWPEREAGGQWGSTDPGISDYELARSLQEYVDAGGQWDGTGPGISDDEVVRSLQEDEDAAAAARMNPSPGFFGSWRRMLSPGPRRDGRVRRRSEARWEPRQSHAVARGNDLEEAQFARVAQSTAAARASQAAEEYRRAAFERMAELRNILAEAESSCGERSRSPPTFQAISRLPVYRYEQMPRKLTDDLESELPQRTQCAICIEAYADGDLLRTLPCLHIFHQLCIDRWLGGQDCCPLCKKPI